MRTIPLTQGKVTLVDDADYERLNRWKWCAIKYGNTWAAVRNSPRNKKGKQETIYMHRVIMGLQKGDKRQIDHINHNDLDNRRVNLRICTSQQNQWNYTKAVNKSSKYKGVCRQNNGWVAYIAKNKQKRHLGYFKTEALAARAYNHAAIKLFGAFAKLNVIKGDYYENKIA